jgi:hypothetical protein
MLRLLSVTVSVVLLTGAMLACTAATSAERDVAVAVVRRYNEELPKAIAAWDTSKLHEYLVDRELAVRTAEINAQRLTGTRSTGELRSFQVQSVEFLEADQARVRTQERWFDTRNEGGAVKRREYDLPQGYLLRKMDGRWYVAENRVIGDVPDFS